MLGASKSPYLEPSEWQLSLGYRTLKAEQHYTGIRKNHEIRSGVVNSQHLLDLAATYAIDRRTNATLSIPFVYTGFSLLLPPDPATGTRDVMRGKGLGDISLVLRRWVLDTERHTDQNASLGIGFKFPTGNPDARDDYRDFTGANRTVKAIDQSIQPGDGGFGVVLDFQGFKAIGKLTFFASGTYLINPRDTNNTPSLIQGLGLGANPLFAGELVNSVPDQYIGRVGVAMPVNKKQSLSATLAARIEGIPPTDLVGDSNGFRRPGYAIFIEPGLIYSKGKSTFALSVPVTVHRNVQDNPASLRREDATMADYVVLFSYSRRFGR
ncbi:MAG: hypothetical protein ACK47B_25560 [Armatimonadota bacterium]